MYEKHVEDDKIARNILLTFMEPNIEILFEEYTHLKPCLMLLLKHIVHLLKHTFNF